MYGRNNTFLWVKKVVDLLDDPTFYPLFGTEVSDNVITVDIPGKTKKDVKVSLKQGVLTVFVEDQKAGVFRIPTTTKPKDIRSKVENGRLTITVSKTDYDQEHELVID